MSTGQTEQEVYADWSRKQLQRSVGIRQAGMAAAVDRLQKMSRLNQRLVRKTQDGTIGKATTEPEDMGGEDMIHVGDLTINISGGEDKQSDTKKDQTTTNAPNTSGTAPPPTTAPTAPTAAPSGVVQPPTPTPTPAPVTAPSGGMSNLKKAAIVSAIAAGSLGSVGAGALLNQWLNPSAPTAHNSASDVDREWQLRLVDPE